MDSNKRTVAIVFLVVVIDLLGFGVVLPLLPRLGERLHASKPTIGLLTCIFSAMQFFFSPAWGRLSDRIGRRPVLIASLVGNAVFYALFAYACHVESLFWMFVSRIGAGIAGATIGTAQAAIADSTSSAKRTGGMALIGAAFGLGFTLGPVIGAVALAMAPAGAGLPTSPGILAALLSAAAAVVAVAMLPESRPAEIGGESRRHRFDGKTLQFARSLPLVPELILSFFVATLAFGQFESTLALVTEQVYGLSDRNSYWIFFYAGVSLVLAQGFLVRRLAKKVADEKLAFAGMLFMLAGIGLGLVSLHTASLALLLVVMPIIVLGFALMTPSLQSMVSKRAPAERQGEVLGVSQAASSLVRVFAPLIGISLLGASIYAPYALTFVLVAAVAVLMQLRIVNSAPAPAAEPPAT